MGLSAAGGVSRRSFARGLLAALIGSLAFALPSLGHAPAPADFGALVRSRASAERIGRRYLTTLPADINAGRLRMMSRTLERALLVSRRDPALAARLLRQGIDEDFRCADTVVVDGWVLSVTEARLCAIIALS